MLIIYTAFILPTLFLLASNRIVQSFSCDVLDDSLNSDTFLIISDTICQLGGASELANYGEYSGAPTESQTYQYAMTILKLLSDGEPQPDGESSKLPV